MIGRRLEVNYEDVIKNHGLKKARAKLDMVVD